MENDRTHEFSLRDIFYVVFRHKWKMIFIFLAITALMIKYASSREEIYHSEAKLMVQIGRESVSLDPTATTGPTVGVNQSRQSEINSEIEILKSRDLVEKVVDALGPEHFFERSVWDTHEPVKKTKKVLQRFDLTEKSLSNRDKVINRVLNGLQVDNIEDSNVIAVGYSTANPQLAQQIVSLLIDFYLEKHIVVHRTPGSYQFFHNQSEFLRGKLTELEDELQTFKSTTGISSVDEQRQMLLNRITSLEQAIEEAEVGVVFSAAKVDSLQRLLADMPEREITEESLGIPNSVALNIRQRLYDLKIQEQELLSNFEEESRVVQVIRRQIEEAEALLDEENPVHTQVKRGLSSSYQKMHLELLTEKATLSSLEAKAEVLHKQLLASKGRLEKLNQDQIEITRLLRDINIHESSYRQYSENLEQLRIGQALENVKISNISVVQPATLPVKPTPTKKLFIVSTGIIFGLISAFAFGFCSEYLDHSIRNPEQVESHLKLPTFTSIPYTDTTLVCPSAKWIGKYSKGSALLRKALFSPTAKWAANTKRINDLTDLSSVQWSVPEKVREEYISIKEQIIQGLTKDGASRPRVIAVTSCVRDEGVSTVAANLAATFAMYGDGETLLIDTNIEHPLAHQIYERELSPGLTNLLVNGTPQDSTITATPVKGLDLLPAGMPKSKLSQPFNFEGFSEQLETLKDSYRYIVVDIPAIDEIGLATSLARLCDGVAFVIETEGLRWNVIRRSTELLARANANILGVILNKRRYPIPEWIYRLL